MSKSNFKTNVEWVSNPRIAISLAIMGVVAIAIVYFLWDKIKAAVADARAKARDEQTASVYGGTTPGLNFNELASTIYSAMRGLGTDEVQVESVLGQLRSNADYAALRTAYKSVNKSDWYASLDARLASEGSESEKKRWRSILASNNIDIYTF